MPDVPIHVIKLGGSLLDLPDLPQRWSEFASSHLIGRPLLIVGGGRAADTVRDFDRRFDLDETAGHWLAVQAMAFNARLVASVLPQASLTSTQSQMRANWQENGVAVLDPIAHLEGAEQVGPGVPHRWSYTSDSIAAHVAISFQAVRLTLLKSTLPDGPDQLDGTINTKDVAEAGLVDGCFSDASRDVPSMDIVNLRHDSPSSTAARCVLR